MIGKAGLLSLSLKWGGCRRRNHDDIMAATSDWQFEFAHRLH
jgi:hypothetical protein